jgi:FkbM family methyltransferase
VISAALHAPREDDFPDLCEARVASARARVRALFDPSAGGSRQIVVFGSGALGRRIVSSARAAGLDVCAAADNDARRQHTLLDGVEVLAPADAAERYGQTAVFIVAIYNPSGVIEQLRRANCRRVATYPEFFWNFSEFVTGLTGLALPEAMLAHADELRTAFALLDDPTSRREFAAQVAWRCTLDDSLLDRPSPARDMHFDRSVYGLSARERLVDCGAFDGDSLRAFLQRTGSSFEHADALEPDPVNRETLERFVAQLPAAARTAITVHPHAASDHNGTLRFDAGLGVESIANDDGAIEVSCRRLDDLIDSAPTLIKMDIEGAEPQALRGAAALIREHRPVLAICAYHYCEHLWELPLLLRTLAPDSRIVLRRYAEQCWETVYYAVPPARLCFNGG